MTSNLIRLALVLGLSIQSPQLYATTPLSASLELISTATFGSQVDSDQDTDAWGIVLSPLAIGTSSAVLDIANQPLVEAGGTGAASWFDANHGSVNFSDVGWTFYTDGANGPNGASVLSSNNRNWRYQFLAEQDGYYRLHGNIVGQGSNLVGLNGFSVELFGGPESFQGVDYLNSVDPTASFDFEANVTGGHVYTATIFSQANIGGGTARTTYMDAEFNWRISAIPEPSSLIVAAVVGAAFCVVRRRV
jgi:hypothetical protein